jgi:hypothetical protein
LYGDSVVVPDQAVRQTAQDCSRILKARFHASSRDLTRFHAISRDFTRFHAISRDFTGGLEGVARTARTFGKNRAKGDHPPSDLSGGLISGL